ncbi:MAG: S-layer homology domain-containing protein [Evtepia sp.]|nr:S-layer homology domain-containing protein [Evtepia sp.]
MKKKLQRLFSVLMAACMAATLAPAALAASDLDGHWGQATMQEFIDRGWLTGYGDGQYGPDNGMTRAEFSSLINRVTGLTEESETISNYTDVASGAWYASDLAKALAAGYMTGTSATTMAPNAAINREQAMTMVTRLLGLTAADTEVEALARFSDASQISSYAQNPIAAMVAAGYVNGTTDGRLVPKKQLTRAEGITILYNALDALTAPAIPETGMVYGTATLTFAEYYAGDVSSVDGYGLDGITSATVDKHVSFNNGMYTNYTEDKTDGYNILGVKNVNVAVDAADYPAYVALNPTFKISRSVPAQYKTVTIVDGKAVYSATNFNVVDTVTDATATLKTGSTWGDYEIDVTEHSTAYIRNSRSDEGFAINAYIQGTILETESGLKVGMEFLQSMWVQPWEISFNVSPESTLNAHIAGWDNLDELSKLVGEKVTKIIFIMPDSTYIYEFDGIYIKPVYPEQADVAASFTAGSAEVAISGVPEDLEDVTVTITCGSGRGATTVASAVEIRDGKVTMDSAYDDTQTYTVKVSSSNYADLVAAVPVNSTQVTQLTQLVEQAKALIDDGTAANDSGLIEHYEEAQALLADVGSATSTEAADLISELTEHLSVYTTP